MLLRVFGECMTLTPSQLLGIRYQANMAKQTLSGLSGMLLSVDLISPEDLVEEPKNHPFEEPQIRIDDTGSLCDDIIKFCTNELRAMDSKRLSK